MRQHVPLNFMQAQFVRAGSCMSQILSNLTNIDHFNASCQLTLQRLSTFSCEVLAYVTYRSKHQNTFFCARCSHVAKSKREMLALCLRLSTFSCEMLAYISKRMSEHVLMLDVSIRQKLLSKCVLMRQKGYFL